MTLRDDLLNLDDDALVAICTLEHTRGSGPGGQKRNKTSSAVRVTHLPTGLSARAEAQRSQLQNRRAALQRLRWRFACSLRDAPRSIQLRSLNPRIPAQAAPILDHLDAHGYSLRDTAASIGVTTGALSAWIEGSEDVLTHVNQSRRALGLRPLRPG